MMPLSFGCFGAVMMLAASCLWMIFLLEKCLLIQVINGPCFGSLLSLLLLFLLLLLLSEAKFFSLFCSCLRSLLAFGLVNFIFCYLDSDLGFFYRLLYAGLRLQDYFHSLSFIQQAIFTSVYNYQEQNHQIFQILHQSLALLNFFWVHKSFCSIQ